MDVPTGARSNSIGRTVKRPFRVGAAMVDPVSRDAEFPGGKERLQPQNLKVLIALARRNGEAVTRSQLIDSCWDGRIIGDDVINHSMSQLRAFAERAGGFMIETIPKTGYRLIDTHRSSSRRRKWMLAGLLALVVCAAALSQFNRTFEQGKPPTPTVAILPLTQSSRDPLAKQLALETRDFLSHTLSEGGFPVKLPSAIAPGRKSLADLIVSGDVSRTNGGARAMIRIEDSATHVIIYSHPFEARHQDVTMLPERVGAQVAAALSWTGALMILDRRHPSDPAMTAELLRQTTMIVEGGDVLRAYEISRRIAPKLPNSAIAQLGLAYNTAFALGELPRDQRSAAVAAARRATDRARALAPEHGGIHAPWCLLHSPVHFAECEDRLRRGMRVDPGEGFAGFFLSKKLEEVGRRAESLEIARLALANDRYKLWMIARVLRLQESQGNTAEAERLYRNATRWWPDHPGLIWNRWAGMMERGDFGAIERFERSLGAEAVSPNDRTPTTLLTAIRTRDLATVRKICTDADNFAITCMIGLAQLGDREAAWSLADELYPRLQGRTAAEEDRLWLNNPEGPQLSFLSSQAAAPLRRDPRFWELAQRTGLANYWNSGRLPDFCTQRHEPMCERLVRHSR